MEFAGLRRMRSVRGEDDWRGFYGVDSGWNLSIELVGGGG
jgi:hypothetical protein